MMLLNILFPSYLCQAPKGRPHRTGIGLLDLYREVLR